MIEMAESIIVSYVENEDPEKSVLVVGKKRINQSIEIINAFQGSEATELWEKLTSPRKENNNE